VNSPGAIVRSMPTLIVRRPNDWGGRFRRLKVVVDGQEAAGLRMNQETRLDLAPGRHEVFGRMDWMRSPELAVTLNDATPAVVVVSLPLSAIVATFVTPRRAVKIRLESPDS
jgi:hypothetical protein